MPRIRGLECWLLGLCYLSVQSLAFIPPELACRQRQALSASSGSALQSSATGASSDIQDSLVSPSIFWPSQVARRDKNSISNADASIDEGDEDDAEEEEEDFYQQVFDSIIKIYATHSEPDYILPWQKKHPSTSTSSGFIIHGDNQIMTNAHSVEYATMIQVQKRGDPTKYQARLLHIANDCDLAILQVDDEDFWGNSPADPLEFGELPKLQDEVEVLGYPQGGNGLSITSGVVSRLELQEYAQSGMHLLAIQIDAAINSGNSGGPVIDQHGKVVGVAFQSLEQAENIGYVVPVTIIQHVLEDIRRHGKYTGFCSLGARFASLENRDIRSYLQLQQHTGGIMIKNCSPTSHAKEYLKPNDVILKIDGIPVDQDGDLPFRPGERVSMLCYIQTKFIGDIVALDVWRKDGDILQMHSIQVPVSSSVGIVPRHWGNNSPPYLIMGGLIFTPLSVPYLEACNAWDEYVSDPISYLLGQTSNAQEKEGDQIVTLLQVLAHPLNLGYDSLCDLHLKKFNGVKVRSLAHLHKLIHECEDEYIKLEFAPTGNLVILKRSSIEAATKDVCKAHSIPTPYYNF